VVITSRKVGQADSTPSFLDMTLATPICAVGCQHSLKEGVVCTLQCSAKTRRRRHFPDISESRIFDLVHTTFRAQRNAAKVLMWKLTC